MVLPEAYHAAEQVRPPQEGTVLGPLRAQYDMVAPAGARMAPVQLELLRGKPALMRFRIEDPGLLHQLERQAGQPLGQVLRVRDCRRRTNERR